MSVAAPVRKRIMETLVKNRHVNSKTLAKRIGCRPEYIRRVRSSIRFLLAVGPSTAKERERVRKYLEEQQQQIRSTWTAEEAEERRTGLSTAQLAEAKRWKPPMAQSRALLGATELSE